MIQIECKINLFVYISSKNPLNNFVLGNPLCSEKNIDIVMEDQANILDQGEVEEKNH